MLDLTKIDMPALGVRRDGVEVIILNAPPSVSAPFIVHFKDGTESQFYSSEGKRWIAATRPDNDIVAAVPLTQSFPKPLPKFEPGHLYRSRGGLVFKILCVDAPGNDPIIGYDIDYGEAVNWDSDGRANGDIPSKLDLIEEVTDHA